MKILVIGSGVPFREHGEVGVTAVNIVFYQLICGLLGLGYEVALQLIFNEHRATTELTGSEEAELRHMADLGVILLPPIYRDEYRQAGSPRSRLAKLGRLASWCLGASDLDDFYPAVVLGDTIEDRVRSLGAKAILTIWSPEGVAAAHGVRDVPRIAYHGDIDFGPAAARIRDRSLFVNGDREGSRVTSRVLLDALRKRLFLARFKRAHLQLMKGVDVIANVTACNADFYTATGHP
ncbi:MAG: hypothetical protein O7D29_08355, partial [Gemmatimonadetes bacterium]|nr:hypothetical protein [Gemmatimonadota bacterium]